MLALGPNHGVEGFLHLPRRLGASVGRLPSCGDQPQAEGIQALQETSTPKTTVLGSSPHAAERDMRGGSSAFERERAPRVGVRGWAASPQLLADTSSLCFVPHNLFALNSRCKVKRSQKKYLGSMRAKQV